MFNSWLESVKDINPKYRHFAEDLSKYLQTAVDEDLPLYAVHGFCTDGGVSGSMIRYAKPHSAIIPLDYWMIEDKHAKKVLSDLVWTGIVDLKPFNTKPTDFWVDHHISAMNSTINANRIRYDIDGDSGAYQLLLSDFLGTFPEHIVELAIMTKTTDTAGYLTEPPVDLIDNVDQLPISTEDTEEGRRVNEKRIWLLDDAWGSVETLKHHLNLYNYLADEGFAGINKVLDRINEKRSGRKEARQIADSIDIDADIIMFSFKDDTQDKFTILRRLQARGVKIAVSLTITENRGVKISLRRNRFLDPDENQKLQLQEVAEKMNGGGHPGAAGAVAESVTQAYEIINKWGNGKGITSKLVEL